MTRRKLTKAEFRAMGATPALMAHRVGSNARARRAYKAREQHKADRAPTLTARGGYGRLPGAQPRRRRPAARLDRIDLVGARTLRDAPDACRVPGRARRT